MYMHSSNIQHREEKMGFMSTLKLIRIFTSFVIVNIDILTRYFHVIYISKANAELESVSDSGERKRCVLKNCVLYLHSEI